MKNPFSDPFPVKEGIITEQLTDEEVSSFHDAVELYLWDEPCESDCIIAMEINKSAWKKIWEYRDLLKSYFDEENDNDA